MLQNARKHAARILGVDACSSGPWFSGWTDRTPRTDRALPRPDSWLLTIGWTRAGPIATHDVPRGGRDWEPSELLSV